MRRIASVSLYSLLFVISVAVLPLTLLLALLYDLARQTRFSAVRCALVVPIFFGVEVAGIAGATTIWASFLLHRDRERFLHQNFLLQNWWTSALFGAARRLFGLCLEVDGVDATRKTPYFLLVRHVSTADTVLPASLISVPFGIRMRYVLKRELLWDPCLDIVGNRLPNAFVARDAGSSEAVAQVSALAAGLADTEALLIFPEGTRFSPSRKARALERLADRPALQARAAAMSHVLPPRSGGFLAMCAARPGVDVVVCAHTGLEGVRSLAEIFRGALVGRTLRVAFWRIPAAEVHATAEWLFDQWKRVDDWAGRYEGGVSR